MWIIYHYRYFSEICYTFTITNIPANTERGHEKKVFSIESYFSVSYSLEISKSKKCKKCASCQERKVGLFETSFFYFFFLFKKTLLCSITRNNTVPFRTTMYRDAYNRIMLLQDLWKNWWFSLAGNGSCPRSSITSTLHTPVC